MQRAFEIFRKVNTKLYNGKYKTNTFFTQKAKAGMNSKIVVESKHMIWFIKEKYCTTVNCSQ